MATIQGRRIWSAVVASVLAGLISTIFVPPAFADLEGDMWIMADGDCGFRFGKGCCAVADDEGVPAYGNDGKLACHCGALAKPTVSDRLKLAKDKANLKMTPASPDTLKAISKVKAGQRKQ